MSCETFVVWLTGLPAAGKTTLGKAISRELKSRGHKVRHLDGDEVRASSGQKFGYTRSDRDRNIKLAIALAKEYKDKGNIVVAGFISPYRKHRQWGRQELNSYIEVFVDSPLEVCEARDPKGMYEKARAGEIEFFTGVSDAYEEPANPDIHLRTDKMSAEECVNKVIKYLEKKDFI